MSRLRISHVAYQPHIVITHPELLGQSLIFRAPEFVKSPDAKNMSPGEVLWEEVERETHLRYRWGEREEVKVEFATDFHGEVMAGEDEVHFSVTMINAGNAPNSLGAFLFCLQAGAHWDLFHDYDGVRTFVRLKDRWASVNEMQEGKFKDHRMCGYQVGDGGVAHNLMAKISEDGAWALGLAIDLPGSVSCNHQLWPSCIHTNPSWGTLAPDESKTARGKVYFLKGDIDQVYSRYIRDFGEER